MALNKKDLGIIELMLTRRNRIEQIRHSVQKEIDRLCEESNYDISYAEIDSALIEILQKNNQRTLEHELEVMKNLKDQNVI